jgi:hypothetical protein
VQESELLKLDGEYDAVDTEIKRDELAEKNRLREFEPSQSQRPPNNPIPPNQLRDYEASGDRRNSRTPDDRREMEIFTQALSMDTPPLAGTWCCPRRCRRT